MALYVTSQMTIMFDFSQTQFSQNLCVKEIMFVFLEQIAEP